MNASRSRSLVVGLVALLCLAHSVFCQTAIPYVVRDLYVFPNPYNGNFQPGPLIEFSGFGYFAATSTVNGRELWRTDGTAAGTTLVRDINPGLSGSSPADFTIAGGMLYFTADDGTHGREVWRTDGTPGGTRMIADIFPGSPTSSPANLAAAGSRLVFNASSGTNDIGLCYAYDGSTLSGLRPTGACCLQSGACLDTSSGACAALTGSMWGGLLTTCASTACNQPLALSCCLPDITCVYTSSANCAAMGGTPGAPNITCGNCPDPALFTCCTGTSCTVGPLSACTGSFLYLVSSCSPNPCTQPESACCLPSGQCFMVRFASDCTSRSGTLLPAGQTCISTTYDLNCTQPTFACCRITGICTLATPSNCRSSRGFVQPLGVTCAPGLCFVPNTTNNSPTSGRPVTLGNQAIVFAQGGNLQQIWSTDGTLTGTLLVGNGPSDLYIPTRDSNAGGRLYFVSTNSSNPSSALWSTDGTTSGTGPVTALAGTTASPNLTGIGSGGLYYFAAQDGSSQTQIWCTDNTPANTRQLTSSALGSQPLDLTAFQGGVMFSLIGTDQKRRWWFSDGTLAGTRLVGPTGTSFLFTHASERTVVGNSFFFAAGLSGSAPDLWITDGTTPGTHQVFPIPLDQQAMHPGDPRNWSGLNPSNLSVSGGRAYFQGTDLTDPAHPETDALWASDGTLDGTAIVAHIPGGPDSTLSEMAAGSGNDLFFAAQTPTQGIELYRTGGTAGSTQIVKDINPGVQGSDPAHLTYNNGLLLFNAYDVPARTNKYLYRSDGTISGTYPLGSSQTYCCGGSRAARPIALGNQLLYFEATPQTGVELWRSDGTGAGTGLVAEAISGTADGVSLGSPQPVVYNGASYYAALNGFYKSNGTAGGTVRLLTVSVGTAAATWIYASPIGVLFAGPSGVLYISDGTVAGTHPLSATAPGYDTTTFAYANGLVYFTGYAAASGWEVWATDGTSGGTRLVSDLTPGNAAGINGPRPRGLTAFGTNIYYVLPNSGGTPVGWYVTDGTAAGTHSIFTPAEFPHTIDGFFPGNGVLFISASDTSPARRDLWSYSGTVASLIKLTANDTTNTLTASFAEVTVAGAYTYFMRYNNSTFVGLYRSDGTITGTVQVLSSPNQYSNTSIGTLVPFGNDIFLRTSSSPSPSNSTGGQLYRTNAPALGLQVVADFAPSGAPTNLAAVGASLFFSASTPQQSSQLYITDGSPAGARQVSPINTNAPLTTPSTIRKAGSLFFFNAGQNTPELYRTDGTIPGTFLLDIFAGGDASVAEGVDLGGTLCFRGYKPAVGSEPWRSDGTIAGTHIITDAIPGSGNCGPSSFATIGSQIFFTGYALSGATSIGIEPYASDGTAAGTHPAADLAVGTDSYASHYTDLNGLAIFIADNVTVGGVNIGEEIFRSDGTSAGTYLLRDIYPGVNSSYPRNLTAAGNYVFFSADDGVHGRELWRTDGTVAGTVMVRDICIGNLGSGPDLITAAGDRVYFTAYTPETGVELWTSDGTAGGTFMLFEIVPGPSSANIRALTRAGDRLYFLATVPPQLPSLWSFDWADGLLSGFICAADYNRSGSISVNDIFDYLSDWFIGAYRADVNGDGTVNVQDIFDFLTSWFAGCT